MPSMRTGVLDMSALLSAVDLSCHREGRGRTTDINNNPARLRGMLCYSSEIITSDVSITCPLSSLLGVEESPGNLLLRTES